MIKKILVLCISIIAFTVNVNASTDIAFDEEKFSDYFKEKGYVVQNLPDSFSLTSDKLKNTIGYIAFDKEKGYGIDLYKFNSEEDAYNYFNWVIDDNKNEFTELNTFNLDKTEEVNYSYIKSMLSELHYFYMVSIENYVIKTNIPKEESEVMNEIFDDLGFIENVNKSDNNNNTGIRIILGIVFIVLALLIISIIIIRKIINKRRLNKGIK